MASLLSYQKSKDRVGLDGANRDLKSPNEQENDTSRTPDVKKSRVQGIKASRKPAIKKSRDVKVKNTRVVRDASGRTRRPANVTIADDVKEALDILAIKRRERPWKLLDDALRLYLKSQGIRL